MSQDVDSEIHTERLHGVLRFPSIQTLLGHVDGDPHMCLCIPEANWKVFVSSRVSYMLGEAGDEAARVQNYMFLAGCSALHAFLQSNVTGPPLPWLSSTRIIPQNVREKLSETVDLNHQLISSLTVDGETAYALTPNVELFCLAKCLLNHPAIIEENESIHVRFRLRVNSWHQRMLSEIAPTLQREIYRDLEILDQKTPFHDRQSRAEFLIERATIHIDHGLDERARADTAEAAKIRQFHFALTGRLGKKTKFQQNELSQLVVLAKSSDSNNGLNHYDTAAMRGSPDDTTRSNISNGQKPKDLELNDDTLLESISFSKEEHSPNSDVEQESLPVSLQSLDPANQPVLEPLDSIILLATASSITNISAQDGLTREETLPYATRVLTGPSPNWQIYTQALLVRSRIEGYRSRTTERGLLQLQAIVDQVIAETSGVDRTPDRIEGNQNVPITNSFLPQAKLFESAPAEERLRYIHLLAPPTRWKLESELADRWVSLGGLRSALEIYERLQMWAEVALCWASQDREDEARKVVRNQLYQPAVTGFQLSVDTEKSRNVISTDVVPENEKDPLPHNAPRLFCILGDLEKSVAAYERAWEVSNSLYARAQRSLGRHYFQKGDLKRADEAYLKSLRINPQNHSIWFALGCVRLQIEDWTGAVDAFTRAVQMDDQDAESWSNLAAALLQLPSEDTDSSPDARCLDGMEEREAEPRKSYQQTKQQKHTHEAFVALKRAASLKRESYRIWQNLLQVAIQLSPPPYTDIIVAQSRLIELLGPTQGEKCIDIPIVEGLVDHLIQSPTPNMSPESFNGAKIESQNQPKQSSYEKMVIDLVQRKIAPLVTSSRRLWLLIAKLLLHLQRPSATLSAYEKAWRVTTNQPGWDSGTAETKDLWKDVAEATSDLADAYESLGERTRESGLGAGTLVAKDWKFKARSAIRGIIGRAKESWEGTPELNMLNEKMNGLKAT